MTEQELFWAGQFGDEYTLRNTNKKIIEANIDFFSEALCRASPINTVLECGCNSGMNLIALEYLDTSMTLTGIDINANSLLKLSTLFDALLLPQPFVYHKSILEYDPDEQYDLVFTKGVLIHINPKHLTQTYEKLYTLSKRWILLAEYYNVSPIELTYRGNDGKLFKRDFAGEMMDQFSLRLVDYGFRYHRNNHHPLDDITWFLLEKR